MRKNKFVSCAQQDSISPRYLDALYFLTVNLFHAEFYLAQTYILCNYDDSAMIFYDKRDNVSLLSRL